MTSLRTTNWLLLIIAAALLGHLGWALVSQPVMAETFRLDTCITDRPSERPVAYLHVVTHGMADVIPSKGLTE